MALDVYKDWLGIPDGPRPPDHYQMLRLVKFEDETEKIRSNYRKLNSHVRKYASGPYSVHSQELLNDLAKVMLCLTDAERKRTYDESLGREFAEVDEDLSTVSVAEALRKVGKITTEQVREVESYSESRGLSQRDSAVQMKFVDAEEAAKALAVSLRLTYVDLSETIPDDSVLDLLPRKVVRRYSIIPLFVDDGMLLVACIDDPQPELQEELQLRYEMPARAVLATPLAINQAISKYYAPGARDEEPAGSESNSSGSKRKKPKKEAKQSGLLEQVSQLSSGDSRDRKMLGWLILAWSTIAAVVLDYNILYPLFIGPTDDIWLPFFSTYIVLPAMIYYVFKVFLK